MKSTHKKRYISPEVRVVHVEVEKGFAVSEGEMMVSNPPENFNYIINKANNGGKAW